MGSYTAERFACCDDSHCQNDYDACQPYKGVDVCGGAGAACSYLYSSILSWYDILLSCAVQWRLTYERSDSVAPYCVQYAAPIDLTASVTAYSAACTSASLDANILVLQSPGAAAGDGGSDSIASSTPDFVITSTTSSIQVVTTPADLDNSDTEPSSGDGSENSVNDPSPQNTTDSVLSKAAIVGIVVAGIVVLVLILLGSWCCYRCVRRRERQTDAVQGHQGPGQMPIEGTVYSGETETTDHSGRTSNWVAQQYQTRGYVPN